MADDLKSKAPGSSEATAQFAAEMLNAIQNQGKGRRRPVLVAWSLRMPVGVHRQLQRAAEKHQINMTDIVVEVLRRSLPVLLSEDELRSAAGEEEQ